MRRHPFSLPLLSALVLGAAGVETHDVVLPLFLGVPMKSGQPLAIYAGWHNPGHMLALSRRYYPLLGRRMLAGHRYRVVGAYDSPQQDAIVNGAMRKP